MKSEFANPSLPVGRTFVFFTVSRVKSTSRSGVAAPSACESRTRHALGGRRRACSSEAPASPAVTTSFPRSTVRATRAPMGKPHSSSHRPGSRRYGTARGRPPGREAGR
jgi:hypothetical protein